MSVLTKRNGMRNHTFAVYRASPSRNHPVENRHHGNESTMQARCTRAKFEHLAYQAQEKERERERESGRERERASQLCALLYKRRPSPCMACDDQESRSMGPKVHDLKRWACDPGKPCALNPKFIPVPKP